MKPLHDNVAAGHRALDVGYGERSDDGKRRCSSRQVAGSSGDAELLSASTAGAILTFGRLASAQQAAIPACVVRPAQMEGPYFVEERLLRSDIRLDPATNRVTAGAVLELSFAVSRLGSNGCTPLSGAQVDVWQCDALGVYSDVTDCSFKSVGQKFLRDHQMTDAAGLARFTTIYPGWYPGRAVHIHFKIRTEPAGARGHEFVSQPYFDDALTDRVHARDPYKDKGLNRTRNSGDGIYRDGGQQLMLNVAETAKGLSAPFAIGLQV
jgi:protocatechuate 3,4-dioxygenase beta subunit